MANVALWTGLPGSGREITAQQRVLDTVRAGKSTWWLVDSQRRAEAVETELLQRTEGSLAGVEFVVAGRLPMQMLQFAGVDSRAVPTEVRELLLRELLEEAPKKGDSARPASEGWARKLSEFYLRLQSGEEGLEAKLAKRYPWVLDLLRRYRGILETQGRVDESDLPRIAESLLKESGIEAPELLVVDRLGPVQPSILSLVHALALHSVDTIVILDWVAGGGPALELSREHLEGWQALLQVTEKRFEVEPSLQALYRNLFTASKPEGESSSGPSVSLSYHPDRSAEVRSVARELSRKIHDEGLPPQSAAVICTRLDEYEALIGELFPLYGLLPDIRIGPRLDRNPVARAVLALFELRAGGLSRERMTDLLLNPYVRWKKVLATPEGVLAFDSLARRAGIRDGHGSFASTWREPLHRAIGRMEHQLELAKSEGENEDADEEGGEVATSGARLARLERELGQVAKALGELELLANRIEQLPDSCSSEEAKVWIDGLLKELGVLESANRAARVNPSEGGEDIRAFGQITLLFEHINTALTLHGDTRWTVERYAEAVRFAMNATRMKASSRLRGGVQVGGALELRGLRVDSLFLLGMTASNWPRNPELDLADPFSGHWTQVDRLAESRAMTAEALVAHKYVRFSMPAPRDGEGGEAPSPLLDEIKAAGVRVRQHEDDNSLRSPLELLAATGRNATGEADRLTPFYRALEEAEITGEAAVRTNVTVEMERQSGASLGRYEGQLAGEPIAELIADQTLGRPLSATRLDSYARCPMQYFHGNVLAAAPLEEVEEGVESREVGDILHRVMARTVQRLSELRGGPPDMTENQEQIAQVMDEVGRDELQHLDVDNLLGDLVHKTLLGGLLDENEPPGHLKRLLEKESSVKRLAGATVRFVEAAFGLPPEENQTVLLEDPIVIERDGVRVPLAGRIDRIDYHPKHGWRIYDYKLSGKKSQPSAEKSIMGLNFQLPVYTWALQEWIAQGHGETENLDLSRFLHIRPDEVKLSTGWKSEHHEEHGEEVAERVVSIHEAMRRGRFHHPLSQDSRLCPADVKDFYCPYKLVCRRDPVVFGERPSSLSRESLAGAYTLAFQEFDAWPSPGGEATNG